MKILNYCGVILCILGLIGVRVLEHNLFYDPFLSYFSVANPNAYIPDFEWGALILHYGFRFFLNLIFSVGIIHFLFRKKNWTLQAALLISIVFVIALALYLYCIYTRFEVGYLFSFYMRRFVIQPLVVLLLVPIFYYRKHMLEEEANNEAA